MPADPPMGEMGLSTESRSLEPGSFGIRAEATVNSQEMQRILDFCRENSPVLAENFNGCFLTEDDLELGESGPLDVASLEVALQGPGLIAGFRIQNQGFVVLMPAALPLPGWYSSPDKSQQSRIETLPMEWSMTMLPEDLPCEEYGIQLARVLGKGLAQSTPAEGAVQCPLLVVPRNAPERPDNPPRIWLIGPVSNPIPKPPEKEANPKSVEAPAAPEPSPEDLNAEYARIVKLKQILKLRVPVAVVLAEKKIPMGQFLSISPGAILQFEKSCEDLLELCVNNSLFCRGEAVKIGEKFGLKVIEIGSSKRVDRSLGTVIQT